MRNAVSKFTADELNAMQARTGVDVHALLDGIRRTPSERLEFASANGRNLARLRAASKRLLEVTMTVTGALDPLAILAALHRRQVRFVVIGGVAAYLLGSILPRANFDICFAADDENVRRLTAALNDLHAELQTASGATFDYQMLQVNDIVSFKTDSGLLHCVKSPAFTLGYDDLVASAEHFDIAGMRTDVASLPDLIRMKEATDRPKDRVAAEALRSIRRRRRT
ncbi:MAG TPA: hypothetical protein VHY33_00550 [Thermoanaerobaculia bacterium]|jgi:hypothetical protein|nr:hypothetical protein [Thermoanaerobaculia bacterium]